MTPGTIASIAALAGAVFLSAPAAGHTAAADTTYVGRDIIRMNDKQVSAQALAIKGGKTLLPGFIDVIAYPLIAARDHDPRAVHARGSTRQVIEAGKLADLMILDKNPLTVEPMAIKDIKVVETIKEDRTIYKAN